MLFHVTEIKIRRFAHCTGLHQLVSCNIRGIFFSIADKEATADMKLTVIGGGGVRSGVLPLPALLQQGLVRLR